MAEGTYVKINEDSHHSNENITPGELNQAVDIEKYTARICEQCGQPLPASYIPPADEDWTTGIFGCAEDADTCFTGMFCPCVLFGRNVSALNGDITEQRACFGHAVCVEGGIAVAALTAACSGVVDPDTVCLVTEGLLFAWWVCGIYAGMGRQLLQRKYHLKDSPCDPCAVHCCLHWCAVCQENREMRCRLGEAVPAEDTLVNPPRRQEMMDSAAPAPVAASSSQGSSATNNVTV